ncbi:MAG: hypothetical protein VCA38_03810 [Roseibacillus sp.]
MNTNETSHLAASTLVATLLIISSLTGGVHGRTIEFTFTGVVDKLDSTLTNDFSIGDAIKGSYKVDDTSNRASDLIVTIGDCYVITADVGSVQVSPGLMFLVDFTGVTSGMDGSPVNGMAPLYFDIQLNDPNNILERGVLPTVYPISEFGRDRSNINFPDCANRLDFEVQTIEVRSGPEDPEEPEDLAITSISFTPGGLRLTITHPELCRRVGIEYSPSMSPGSWIELGNFFKVDGVWAFTDPDLIRLARPVGYYRAFLRPDLP